MRILIISQWFDPEPTFKGLAFARELVGRGHEVQVLTGVPNYPGGQVYDGYKIRAIQRERLDGIEVWRAPLYPSHDGSAIRRIVNYVSFFLSSAFFGLFVCKKPDVIYAYHPPLTVGLSACVIGLVKRAPVVCDIQDLWPDTLRATGMINNQRLLNIVGFFCRLVYRLASQIVVLSPGFKSLLVERGVPAEKVHLIYNWCDEDSLKYPVGEASAHLLPAGCFNVVFAGTMGKAQGLDSVLDAAHVLHSSAPDVRLVLVGGGIERDRLKNRVTKEGLTNVVLIPRLPMQEVGFVLARANALLVHLRKDALFRITVPSKTQAYMAIGRPIIMAVEGDAANLIRNARAGVCINSEDPTSLADAILQLKSMTAQEREEMGLNGRRYYEDHLSIREGVSAFERVFASAQRISGPHTS